MAGVQHRVILRLVVHVRSPVTRSQYLLFCIELSVNAQPIQLPLQRGHRWLWITALVLLAAAGVLVGILATHWPFTRAAITKDLEQAAHGKVEITSFHNKYFPWPGCVAEGITIEESSGRHKARITARQLTIHGSYTGLFGSTKHIQQILVDGLRVNIGPGGKAEAAPAANTGQKAGKQNHVEIGEIRADGAVIEVASRDPEKKPLVLQLHQARLRAFALDRSAAFQIAVELSKPAALVESSGHVGPLKTGSPAEIPLTGSYRLTKGDLAVFSAIAGAFTSQGKYNGTLGQLTVDGAADSPDFQSKKNHHRVHLSARFHAVVNGLTGDIALPAVEAHFRNTTLLAHGDISGKQGKTVTLTFTPKAARIEDLMLLFIRRDESPINGPIRFEAKVLLPPEKRRFAEKVRLDGDFDITDAHFKPKTQANVNKLSERTQGDTRDEDIQQVTSRLQGHVELRDGIAHLSNTTFSLPGGTAKLHGTYSVMQDHRVDIHGSLRMDAKLSQATKGAKSFFARFLNPFYKKKDGETQVPVAITGNNKHPKFQAKLTGGR